jgi:hypothetical protein
MCLSISRIERTFSYNWAGDQIVSPLVSAARQVPGSKRVSLDIDVREFLAVEHSAEVRNFFLGKIVDQQPVAERERFFVGKRGSFDFRMRCVIEAFGKFRYLPAQGRGREQWLLPAETLANRGGDCEDLSFLLMALLGEAGISQSCLRLAFGRVVETTGAGRTRQHDHAWVMYQMEGGAWMILDPLERVDQHLRARSAVKPAVAVAESSYEYQPLFVFNRDHLWRVHGPGGDKIAREFGTYLGRRKFWTGYDPAFAMGVHNNIFDNQMKELSWMDRFTVKTASLGLDANVLSYDPRDHCDFAYVDESWQRIHERLATGDVGDLGRACHAVADFYAHTLYGHVIAPVGGKLPLYDPSQPVNPGNKQDAVFDRAKFSINNKNPLYKTDAETRAHWQGKLISGQWWRSFTTYPDDIQNPEELDPRRCLPDHDLLAVDDEATADNPAHLYSTKEAYNDQFKLRKSAAERHVRAVFLDWRAKHP